MYLRRPIVKFIFFSCAYPWWSLPRFLVNDNLGSLDSHVPDDVVPVANAQKGVPEPLDQPQRSVFTGAQKKGSGLKDCKILNEVAVFQA